MSIYISWIVVSVSIMLIVVFRPYEGDKRPSLTTDRNKILAGVFAGTMASFLALALAGVVIRETINLDVIVPVPFMDVAGTNVWLFMIMMFIAIEYLPDAIKKERYG